MRLFRTRPTTEQPRRDREQTARHKETHKNPPRSAPSLSSSFHIVEAALCSSSCPGQRHMSSCTMLRMPAHRQRGGARVISEQRGCSTNCCSQAHLGSRAAPTECSTCSALAGASILPLTLTVVVHERLPRLHGHKHGDCHAAAGQQLFYRARRRAHTTCTSACLGL